MSNEKLGAFLVLLVVFAAGMLAISMELTGNNAAVHDCVRAGYANTISINGDRFCYRIVGDTGTLVSVESLRKEIK
jgi:hypothetical protein